MSSIVFIVLIVFLFHKEEREKEGKNGSVINIHVRTKLSPFERVEQKLYHLFIFKIKITSSRAKND